MMNLRSSNPTKMDKTFTQNVANPHVDGPFDTIDEEASVDNESIQGSDHLSQTRGTKKEDNKEEWQAIAQKTTRAVSYIRIMMVFILLVTAGLVLSFTYLYTHRAEHHEFDDKFRSNGDAILVSFQETITKTLGALDSFAIALTSHSLSNTNNETFPMVTLPHLEVRGSSARVQADGLYMVWTPLVTNETRKAYEEYTVQHQDLHMESFMRDAQLRAWQDKILGYTVDSSKVSANGGNRRLEDPFDLEKPLIRPRIWTPLVESDAPENSTIMFPLWQSSPVLPFVSLVNIDYYKNLGFEEMYATIVSSKQAVLGNVKDAIGSEGINDSINAIIKAYIELGQHRHNTAPYITHPLTSFGYPVFDTFDLVNRQVAGVVQTNIYWGMFFTDTLSSDVSGMICVVEDKSGVKFTYRIDGPDATFLGFEDLHDPKYDEYVLTKDVTRYLETHGSVSTQSYTTVSINDEFNSYTLYVYPSDEMRGLFITKNPTYYTIVVASIFLFTSLVFLVYDWLVEKRQKNVMTRAVKSSAMVSSLFPAAVRDRLYEENENEPNNVRNDKNGTFKNVDASKTTSGFNSSTQRKLKNALSPGNNIGNSSTRGRPIAEKFENATVFFADIVGFTHWSAEREPEDVFTLLETLYGAFDKVAQRRKVFKVETIGDSYMAVTGVPEPQTDHAVVMVKFAHSCLITVKKVLQELASELGEDTTNLDIRIGLHSGRVTAGVLRGDRARFQLFGDTVNTASRMESHGVPGRIHCSQGTADALTLQGKEHWLQIRPDKIVPKGKVAMQTYFVYCDKASNSSDETSTVTSLVPHSAQSTLTNPKLLVDNFNESKNSNTGKTGTTTESSSSSSDHSGDSKGYFKQLYPNPDLRRVDGEESDVEEM